MVPMNIGQWKGIAILDTSSSYPLVNETMWAGVTGQGDTLNPWLRGLLYLADGEGKQRLRWVDVKLIIQSHLSHCPVSSCLCKCLCSLKWYDWISFALLACSLMSQRTATGSPCRYQFLWESTQPDANSPASLALFRALSSPSGTSLSSIQCVRISLVMIWQTRFCGCFGKREKFNLPWEIVTKNQWVDISTPTLWRGSHDVIYYNMRQKSLAWTAAQMHRWLIEFYQLVLLTGTVLSFPLRYSPN